MAMEEELARVAKAVDGGGVHISYMPGDELGPSVGFTTGLWRRYKAPEFCVVGAPEGVIATLLAELVAETSQVGGAAYKTGRQYDHLLDGANVEFVQVDERYYEEFFQHAVWYYQHHTQPPERFPVLQCVMPCTENLSFPWEERWPAHLDQVQPLLGSKL
jgi:Domain of unknown function (DUF4262)